LGIPSFVLGLQPQLYKPAPYRCGGLGSENRIELGIHQTLPTGSIRDAFGDSSSHGIINNTYSVTHLRMGSRRFTRLTNGFSKKLDNHVAAVALYVAHYNLCRTHEALRTTPAKELRIALGPLRS
jgi:hypothetical protein